MRQVIRCVALSFFAFQLASSLIGDICRDERKGKNGYCKPLTNCTSAKEDLMKHTFPVTCGFSINEVIVCCFDERKSIARPGNGKTNSTAAKGTSAKKCEEYNKIAQEPPPRLLPQDYVPVVTCSVRTKQFLQSDFARAKQVPHAAAIGYNDTNKGKLWKCSGALLSELYVLTSASCAYSDAYGFARYVRLGDLDLSTVDDDAEAQERDILEIAQHPGYSQYATHDDIALIKLATPATLNSFVRPACLPSSSSHPRFDDVQVSGWGTCEDEELRLKQKIFKTKNCCRNGAAQKFCAALKPSDGCSAELGAPAVIYSPDVGCSYVVVGVSSSWERCDDTSPSKREATFTSVSKYVGWIENNVWS